MLPKLYAIVDAGCFTSETDVTGSLCAYARELAAGGVTLLQYRNKNASSREMLSQARELRRTLGRAVQLVMNDRADICLAADFDGTHLGQDDLEPEFVRRFMGPSTLLGFSTHNPEQVRRADLMPVDYIAVGPVFATTSKENPDPVIGLEGVQVARMLTGKPLVAIGGITQANCRQVIEAGADSVAVISGLLHNPRERASEFLAILS
jgi:thiamine-phosphate pyrophosphorylase